MRGYRDGYRETPPETDEGATMEPAKPQSLAFVQITANATDLYALDGVGLVWRLVSRVDIYGNPVNALGWVRLPMTKAK